VPRVPIVSAISSLTQFTVMITEVLQASRERRACIRLADHLDVVRHLRRHRRLGSRLNVIRYWPVLLGTPVTELSLKCTVDEEAADIVLHRTSMPSNRRRLHLGCVPKPS